MRIRRFSASIPAHTRSGSTLCVSNVDNRIHNGKQSRARTAGIDPNFPGNRQLPLVLIANRPLSVSMGRISKIDENISYSAFPYGNSLNYEGFCIAWKLCLLDQFGVRAVIELDPCMEN
jgi:hypothetical protein